MSRLIAAVATCVAALAATPAYADLVFRFHNNSNVEAKGIMQNVGTVWLRRGQAETVRAKGDWTGYCVAHGIGCDTVLADTYVANFQHLADGNMQQYCVWRIKRTISVPRHDTASGVVTLSIDLEHQDPGFTCHHGGQTSAPYKSGKLTQGKGMTVDFVLSNR